MCIASSAAKVTLTSVFALSFRAGGLEVLQAHHKALAEEGTYPLDRVPRVSLAVRGPQGEEGSLLYREDGRLLTVTARGEEAEGGRGQ